MEGLRGKLCFSEQLIEELKEHEEQERQRFELQIRPALPPVGFPLSGDPEQVDSKCCVPL